MPDKFPPIEPYDHGKLEVGEGHQVYWERCGNPVGKPAIYLHGGPGAGCTPGARRYFDPDVYNVVLFDQRGSGRSQPLASEPDADLCTNTTFHLIADIEALRNFCGVDKWTILGVSWGTTLGLAYGQTYPERIDALVLALVTTTSRREVDWITEGVGRIFPGQWERFASAVPENLRHLRLVDAYVEMLFDSDPAVREHAASEWCAWEDAHVSLNPGYQSDLRYRDPEFRLRFARLVTHYWRHHAFLEEDQLLRNAAILNGIPGVLIHGRYDVSSPLETAWRLSKEWTTSRLHVLENTGHGDDVEFPQAVVAALNQFR